MDEFKKITFETIYEAHFNLKDNVCDLVYKKINNALACYGNKLLESLVDCESPIEQLLALEMARINLLGINLCNPFIDVLGIENQVEIECQENTYRVDFFITVNYKNQGIKYFVIECDGHEFHQKTKKQVENDNKRTRDLQKKGCEIIRFSGTEIWHKSNKCACEIRNIIMSKCEYKKEV